ncbi:MAG: PQQ-binding-like beta-propeller repeat protein [Tannerella sp.]|jgi:outer membrane protein assembly factor BamB/ferredoxin|nr:PQQ-binding-like beta-propeller repeat protein [Tannerella sp.]
MQISINNKPFETLEGETLIETARRNGIWIPSLCYAKGKVHKSSCMVCAVKNLANGQIIPSCTTLPTEDLRIDTESEEVQQVRELSLELLLSDHRADCEAPCALVCPKGLEIEQMLAYYDAGLVEKAGAVVAAAFALPEIVCDTCKAPCEKACRRGTVDKAVAIRDIVHEVAGAASSGLAVSPQKDEVLSEPLLIKTRKDIFLSRLGRFTEKEKNRLKATVKSKSRCLHCACAGREDCKLRRTATDVGIKRTRYEASSALPAMDKRQAASGVGFEAAKCVRCGLCVYNSEDGFTFKDRGFGMQIVLPKDSAAHVGGEQARLCPTGALYLLKTLAVFLGLFFLSACSGGASSSGSLNWKLFRGDAALSGYTSTPLPKHPVLKWMYKGGVRTLSSPVIDRGTTYWCDRKGLISGVDLQGKRCFDYDLHTTVEATPMIADSVLYIGRIDGLMSAVSLARRDTLWNFPTEGQIIASPNLMDFKGRQALVFGSYDDYLYCVDARSGKKLSAFETGYYINGAAALWKGHVIFGGCDAWVRIINCETGQTCDSLALDAYVPASPAIMGDYCYVAAYSGNVYQLLLADGKISRHKKIVSDDSAEGGSFVSMPAVSPDALYFFSGNRYLKSINRVDGTLRWKYLLKGEVGESSPLICNDKVLVCTKTGIVSILDAEKGRLLWEYDTGEQIVGSPAVIRGHFMVLTAKGSLFCFGEK